MSEPGFTIPHPAQFRILGRVLYGAGLRMQKAMAGHVTDPLVPDQILILEHNPVFTLGRHASRQDIHVDDAFLKAQGVEIFQTDRGGQVTYHGPGQVVVYPICALRGPRQDLGRFVRGLEEVMIRTAKDFGIAAQRLKGFPGVWVETQRGYEKLGALGIHLKKWIATHGIAFNVDPDLAHFRWITPCGITDKGVCSLKSLLGGSSPTWQQAAERLQAHFTDVLALEAQPVSPPTRSISALTWRRSQDGLQILMMLRQPEQGFWWSSVTGMLEPGESMESGAVREVQEETGLNGTLRTLDFSHTFWVDPTLIGLPPGEPRFNTETCFQMEVPSDADVRLCMEEHSEYRWCSIPEASSLMRWEGSLAALDLLERWAG
jgi:lipoyl(octanoyl) transferase